ncbi:MAG: OmpP1/FadL family transporter [Methylophagaceae bacterium]
MSLFRQLLLASLFVSLVSPAFATNGYLAHGYGIKSKGMAGAGVALPQDSLIAATNPAGIAFVGNRLDIGLSVFSPNREFEVSGAATPFFPLADGKVKSDRDYFIIPEFGMTWQLDDHKSFGVTITGNGGMNTKYSSSANVFGGGAAGVDLAQIFLAPTFAYRFDNNASIGVSAILAYQSFEAKGLGGFGMLSTSPTNLSDNGHDSSFGAGINVGFIFPVSDKVTLGGGYRSRVYMSEFDDYKGLFAEQGGFDIPASATIGLAWKTTDNLTVLLDVQKTWYSQIDSVSNPMNPALTQCLMMIPSSCLGGNNGVGFGWDDMTTVKFGVQYQASNDWTWRAGYSHGNQPIPDSEVFFNILAPGVIEEHFTVGFTKKFDGGKQEINFGAMYAPSHTVTGLIPSGQTVELTMKQYQFELGWSLLF